jgi:hypothetical protein
MNYFLISQSKLKIKLQQYGFTTIVIIILPLPYQEAHVIINKNNLKFVFLPVPNGQSLTANSNHAQKNSNFSLMAYQSAFVYVHINHLFIGIYTGY